MKRTINEYEFIDTMKHYDFSYDGCKALFEYFESYERNTNDQEIEFDPLAISCEYTEYADLDEIAKDYGEEYGDLDYLEQTTDVILFDKGIIIQNF